MFIPVNNLRNVYGKAAMAASCQYFTVKCTSFFFLTVVVLSIRALSFQTIYIKRLKQLKIVWIGPLGPINDPHMIFQKSRNGLGYHKGPESITIL